MHLIYKCFNEAMSDLSRPALRPILLLCIGLTLVAILLFIGGIVYALTSTQLLTLGWADTTVDILGGVGAVVVAWFLIPVLMPALAGLFEEAVIRRIEKSSYPHSPAPQDRPLVSEIWQTLRFVLLLLALNIIFLPLFFLPLVGWLLYYMANGWFVGSAFFTTVADYREGMAAAAKHRRQHRISIWLCGIMLVALANIPLLNLLMPIFGISVMTHLYHQQIAK